VDKLKTKSEVGSFKESIFVWHLPEKALDVCVRAEPITRNRTSKREWLPLFEIILRMILCFQKHLLQSCLDQIFFWCCITLCDAHALFFTIAFLGISNI